MVAKLGSACTGCGKPLEYRDPVVPVRIVNEVGANYIKMDEVAMDAYHLKCFAKLVKELGETNE